MKNAIKLSILFLSALMVLAVISPALAVSNSISATKISILNSVDGADSSYNWSGYAVTGTTDSVTSVSGSWMVPTVTGSNGQYAAFWTGIDGFTPTSNTVEQTGILAEVINPHKTTYSAWYECYPNPMVTIQNTVKAGDTISASVTYANNEFTITITDIAQGWTYSTSQTSAGSQRSSAEWIVEAPAEIIGSTAYILPLANFGTASFGSDYTSVIGTCSVNGGSISTFGTPIAINMVNSGGSTIATTSQFSQDGTSFTVMYGSGSSSGTGGSGTGGSGHGSGGSGHHQH